MIAWLSALSVAAPLHNGLGTPFGYGADGGRVAFGVFQPVVVGLSERVDLSTSGLATLMAPRADLKWTLADGGDERVRSGLAATAGLGVPTGGLLLSRGFLFSDTAAVPFALVGKLGATAGLRTGPATVGLGAEMRAALKVGDDDLRPTGLWFFDPMIAPLTEGPVAAVRGLLALSLVGDDVLVKVDAHAQFGGQGTDGIGTLLLAWRPVPAFAVAAGVAGAVESGDDGVDGWGVPLGDLWFRF
jgi:hypothetical protein